MKTKSLGVLATFALVATMTSCGGGMTPEQIQAEAQKKFDAEKTELETVAKENCESNMEAYTAAALEELKANGGTSE